MPAIAVGSEPAPWSLGLLLACGSARGASLCQFQDDDDDDDDQDDDDDDHDDADQDDDGGKYSHVDVHCALDYCCCFNRADASCVSWSKHAT